MLRPFEPYQIKHGEPAYPSSIAEYLADNAPKTITAIGNPDILQSKTLAIFCSNKCPGNIILKTYRKGDAYIYSPSAEHSRQGF